MHNIIYILGTIACWLMGRDKNKALKANNRGDLVSGDGQYAGTAAATCCRNKEWTNVADFDRAAGFDFYLGRCANCSKYLLSVSYADWPTEHVIGKKEAEQLLRLKGTPKLRKALRRLVGEG